jgi:hypothetical protein
MEPKEPIIDTMPIDAGAPPDSLLAAVEPDGWDEPMTAAEETAQSVDAGPPPASLVAETEGGDIQAPQAIQSDLPGVSDAGPPPGSLVAEVEGSILGTDDGACCEEPSE